MPGTVLNRRRAIALVGAAPVLPALLGSSPARAATFKFVYGTQEGSVSTLPLLIAQSQGYLAAESLDVDYVFAPSSNATAAALASGQIDLCARVVTAVVDLRNKGVDARLIAAVTPKPDYQIVVRADAKVPTAGQGGATWQDTIRALKGATMATNGPGAPIDLQMQEYFRAAGLSDKDFTGVAIGEGAAQIAALTAGTVDAVVYTTLVARITEEKGIGKSVLAFADAGPELISNMAAIGTTATDRLLARYPDFGDRFRRAIGRALAFMTNPANSAVLVKTALDNGQAIASPHIAKYMAEIASKYAATFTVRQVQNAIDFQKATGRLDKASTLAPRDIAEAAAMT